MPIIHLCEAYPFHSFILLFMQYHLTEKLRNTKPCARHWNRQLTETWPWEKKNKKETNETPQTLAFMPHYLVIQEKSI